jgi:DHA1 family inner membrane transport protein
MDASGKLMEQGRSTSEFRDHLPKLMLLSFGAFTTALNVTMLSPLIPDIAREFDVSESAAGQLATLTAASSGIFAVVVAPWMDRYPRSFWFRFECTLLAIGSVLTAVSPAFGLMFIGRFLCGIGGAVIGANCLAACGDIFQNNADRNKAIGIVNTAFTLGAVVGLPVMALVADWSSWRVSVALPAVAAGAFLLGIRNYPARAVVLSGSVWGAWRAGYARVFRNRQTIFLLATEVTFMVVWFGWLIYFGAFTENVYATGAALLSLMFFVGGGTEMIANNLAASVARRWPTRAIFSVCASILSINLLLVGVAYDREWTMFPFIAVGSGISALMFVCLNFALLDSAPGAEGAVMSLQSASLELGGSLGVALTGLALALVDDYEHVYQLLGVLTPLMLVTLWLGTRTQAALVPAEAAAD